MHTLIQVWETDPLRYLLLSGLLGIVFSICYVLLGYDAVETIIELRTSASSGKDRRLKAEDIDLLLLIWPFALVLEVTVHGVRRIIKRQQ